MAEWWQMATCHKRKSQAQNMQHGGYWAVCRCIPCQPQHLVPECQVLPTKHNSSVSLSGCHFTKPERLLEITSICGKINERGRGWCKTWLPPSMVPARAARYGFFFIVQINQAKWDTIASHLPILSPFASPPIMPSSHSDIPNIPLSNPSFVLIFQSSPTSHPACFYIPSATLLHPSLHPSAHCVMSLLCESECFVWQPEL